MTPKQLFDRDPWRGVINPFMYVFVVLKSFDLLLYFSYPRFAICDVWMQNIQIGVQVLEKAKIYKSTCFARRKAHSSALENYFLFESATPDFLH